MPDELEIMRQAAELIAQLSEEQLSRAMPWLNARFGYNPTPGNKAGPSASANGKSARDSTYEPEFVDFADLFHAANPQDQATRALLAAYWVMKENGGEAFQSQPVNALLKDLGFHVSNITDALSQNMREKPALIVQTKKSGSSRQARKTYKVTDAGKRRVMQMTSGTAEEE